MQIKKPEQLQYSIRKIDAAMNLLRTQRTLYKLNKEFLQKRFA